MPYRLCSSRSAPRELQRISIRPDLSRLLLVRASSRLLKSSIRLILICYVTCCRESEDTMLLMLRETYAGMGILPDKQLA